MSCGRGEHLTFSDTDWGPHFKLPSRYHPHPAQSLGSGVPPIHIQTQTLCSLLEGIMLNAGRNTSGKDQMAAHPTHHNSYSKTNCFVLFTVAKIWEPPKCPSTDDWIKIWYIHTVEYYSTIKKQRNSATGRNMDGLGDIMLSEKKVRKILYDITYMWNLKKYNTPGNKT